MIDASDRDVEICMVFVGRPVSEAAATVTP